MSVLYRLLSDLTVAASTKKKEEILRAFRHDKDALFMFILALDPRVLFNTSTVADAAPSMFGYPDDGGLLHDINLLVGQRGNILRTNIEVLMSCCNEEQQEVARRIILKDLRCNVGAKLVNKVWPDSIYIHPYMGCKPDTKANRAALHIEEGAYVQEKCDGMYVSCVRDGRQTHFYTRQGKELFFDPAVDGVAIIGCTQLPNGVWQGEMRVRDSYTKELLPRHLGNGIIRTALIPGEFRIPEGHSITVTLWDHLTLEENTLRHSDRPYSERFDCVKSQCPPSRHIKPVLSLYTTSWDSAGEFYHDVLSTGGEGCVVKRSDGCWTDGKPAWQVKMKVEESCDMLVTGVIPHTKRPDRIGALQVQSSDGELKARCGGLMDRAMIRAQDWVGRVIRMKFNALSPYGRFDHPRVDNGSPAKWDACLREVGSEPHTAGEIREIYNAAIRVE